MSLVSNSPFLGCIQTAKQIQFSKESELQSAAMNLAIEITKNINSIMQENATLKQRIAVLEAHSKEMELYRTDIVLYLLQLVKEQTATLETKIKQIEQSLIRCKRDLNAHVHDFSIFTRINSETVPPWVSTTMRPTFSITSIRERNPGTTYDD